MAHFERLRNTLGWRDIPGCPERYVLVGRNAELDDAVRTHGSRRVVPSVSDPVWVLMTDDGRGALLSYEKQDGSFVHTLNSMAGLERKCAAIGLDLAELRRDILEGTESDGSWDLLIEDLGADRVWGMRFVRRWTELSGSVAVRAVAEPPLRLPLGLSRRKAVDLLVELREHGGDGRLIASD